MYQLLGRDLLHFACRHHVLEILAAAAFKAVTGHPLSRDTPLQNISRQIETD